MIVAPSKTSCLEHRVDFVCASLSHSALVVASNTGRISVCDPRSVSDVLTRSWMFSAPSGHEGDLTLRALTAHPSLPILAIIGVPDGRIAITDLDGSTLREVEPPALRSDELCSSTPAFWGCQYDAGGQGLWSVAPVTDGKLEVHLRSTRDWSVVASGFVPNLFGDCYCGFMGIGPPGVAALLLGREGDTDLFFLRQSGTAVEWTRESRLLGPGPVAFSPTGNECLMHENAVTGLHRLQFPSLQPIGECESMPEGILMGSPAVYLDDKWALLLGYPGRVLLFDVREMRAVEEVIVKGHEPRPLQEWGWYQGPDADLHTDITSFVKVGTNLVLVYNFDYRSCPHFLRDGLMTIPIADLIGHR